MTRPPTLARPAWPALSALPDRTRARVTGAVCALLLLGLPFTAGRPLAVFALTFLLVVATGRSRLPWANGLTHWVLVKLSIRVGVFAVPLLLVGFPFAGWSWIGAAVACLTAAVGLSFQRRDLRIMLSPRILRLQPYDRHTERLGDSIYWGLGGVAQEYLYRGVLLAALQPLIGWSAVPVAAVLFLMEHLFQRGGSTSWDRHDVIWQLAMSAVLGTVVLTTGSLAAAMLGHALYNSPSLIRTLLRPGPTPVPATA